MIENKASLSVIEFPNGKFGYVGSVLFESDDGRYGPIAVNETIDPIQLIFKIDKVKSDLESLGFEKPSPKLVVWMCYT